MLLNSAIACLKRQIGNTDTHGFISFNIACKWKRKINGVAPKKGWFILTNFEALELAISAYKKRFDIVRPWRSRRVEMFRYFKKGGYNLTTLSFLPFISNECRNNLCWYRTLTRGYPQQ